MSIRVQGNYSLTFLHWLLCLSLPGLKWTGTEKGRGLRKESWALSPALFDLFRSAKWGTLDSCATQASLSPGLSTACAKRWPGLQSHFNPEHSIQKYYMTMEELLASFLLTENQLFYNSASWKYSLFFIENVFILR